jgi:hypothetical protein
MLRWRFYSSVGWESAVKGGWPTVVVWIQCFSFSSKGETTWRSIAGRWNEDSELILATWEWSVTRRGGVMTLDEGEATSGRGKRVDNISWADTNFIGLKMKKVHVVDSVATNGRWIFKTTMSYLKKYMKVIFSFVHLIA